jgi:Uma2 family endonuclease
MSPRSPRSHRAVPAGRDITVYPVEETVGEAVGEGILQRLISEQLRPLVARWFETKNVTAFVGADQFIYFRPGDVRKRVVPDVYVLQGVSPTRRIGAWKVWEEGVVPNLAFEIVSTNVDKAYIDSPPLYDELGVSELVIFDPDYEVEPGRVRFQVYRRLARRGLVRVTVTNEDRVRSKVLGCWLRAVGSGDSLRLRLAVGPSGDELFPTESEAASAEAARERAEKERERAEKEHERAARRLAEEEIARLRAELAAAKRSKSKR